jgi:hypothetical protein
MGHPEGSGVGENGGVPHLRISRLTVLHTISTIFGVYNHNADNGYKNIGYTE